MTLTKAEAIRRHRLLWNWIAQTSIQEQRCVSKPEAFKHFGWEYAHAHCWCCEYVVRLFGYWDCSHCPILWPDYSCASCKSDFDLFLFDRFSYAFSEDNYIEVAKIAYKIAELPERKENDIYA